MEEAGAASGTQSAEKQKEDGPAAGRQREAGETHATQGTGASLVSIQTPSNRHQGQLQPAGVCLKLAAVLKRGAEAEALWLVWRGRCV